MAIVLYGPVTGQITEQLKNAVQGESVRMTETVPSLDSADILLTCADDASKVWNYEKVARLAISFRAQGIENPIVAYTNGNQVEEAKLIALGVYYCVADPGFIFTTAPGLLNAVLSRISCELHGTGKWEFTFSGLSYNPNMRRLIYGEKSKHLTARAGSFLMAVMQKPGTVVSPAQIIARVYGTVHVESHITNVYISRLRSMLDELSEIEGAGFKCLKTIHSAGFYFDIEAVADCFPRKSASQIGAG